MCFEAARHFTPDEVSNLYKHQLLQTFNHSVVVEQATGCGMLIRKDCTKLFPQNFLTNTSHFSQNI